MASIYSAGVVTNVGTAPTGVTHLDDLIAGPKWGAGGLGTGATVTFSFATAFDVNPLQADLGSGSFAYAVPAGARTMDAGSQALARATLQKWASVANLNFVETADRGDTMVVGDNSSVGDIRFATALGSGLANAAAPGLGPRGGDVWIPWAPIGLGPSAATYAQGIGRALGLESPPSVAGGATRDSVMDFHSQLMSHYPSGPLLHDVAAIQRLYGANHSWHSGNDVYSWAPGAKIFECIWDGGGIDTLDASNQTKSVDLHLSSGIYSTIGAEFFDGIGMVRSNLVVAYGAWIENATGTHLADTITGNRLENTLMGRGGDDVLRGAEAVDRVVDGRDYIYGEDGNDRLEGLGGNDWLFGGNGHDILVGDLGDDRLYGQAGNDSLDGGSGNDSLDGGSGNDSLDGGSGADRMAGGTGNDQYSVDDVADLVIESAAAGSDLVMSYLPAYTLAGNVENLRIMQPTAADGTGNSQNNYIYAAAGNNVIHGGAGSDTVSYHYATAGVTVSLAAVGPQATGGSGTDTLVSIESVSGSSHNDWIAGHAGANALTGGAGSDTLVGRGGSDIFALNSLVGSDAILDFASGADKVRVSQAGIRVGDGDTAMEGAVAVAGSGGFSSAAELVVVTGNILGSITAASAAARIGSATTAYASGQTALFAVDNGVQSALYLFRSNGADATVGSSELTLLATLQGAASTTTGDYLFGV